MTFPLRLVQGKGHFKGLYTLRWREKPLCGTTRPLGFFVGSHPYGLLVCLIRLGEHTRWRIGIAWKGRQRLL